MMRFRSRRINPAPLLYLRPLLSELPALPSGPRDTTRGGKEGGRPTTTGSSLGLGAEAPRTQRTAVAVRESQAECQPATERVCQLLRCSQQKSRQQAPSVRPRVLETFFFPFAVQGLGWGWWRTDSRVVALVVVFMFIYSSMFVRPLNSGCGLSLRFLKPPCDSRAGDSAQEDVASPTSARPALRKPPAAPCRRPWTAGAHFCDVQTAVCCEG